MTFKSRVSPSACHGHLIFATSTPTKNQASRLSLPKIISPSVYPCSGKSFLPGTVCSEFLGSNDLAGFHAPDLTCLIGLHLLLLHPLVRHLLLVPILAQAPRALAHAEAFQDHHPVPRVRLPRQVPGMQFNNPAQDDDVLDIFRSSSQSSRFLISSLFPATASR